MEMLLPPVLFPLLLFLFCCSWVEGAMDCKENKIVHTVVVDQQGKGEFRTIQAPLDSIKENNDRWIKVHINAGMYTEKVQISIYKSCIFIEGVGKEVMTITSSGFNNTSTININTSSANNNQSDNTSAAFVSSPPNVIVIGITFEDCTINATHERSFRGFVTSQFHDLEIDTSGFVFRACVIGIGRVNLGRAWGPYSRVIFHRTYLSPIVSPEGWNAWDYAGQESKLTYAEVDCTRSRANTAECVKWKKNLIGSQLNEFSLSSFINQDGWLAYLPITF